MTLQQLKDTAAAYLERTSSDLTVNGVDLFLVAVNQARRSALMSYDFEFTRVLAQLAVDGVSGGSLDGAVLAGTNTAVVVGTIVEVGLFDDAGNLIPVEWTTTSESLERQRAENRFGKELSVKDECGPHGQRRVTFTGSQAYVWPKQSGKTFTLGVECFSQQGADWTDLTASPAPWSTIGQQYLLWFAIVQLNNLFKAYVPRQEGNLPPPTQLVKDGLEAIILWDSNRFEQNRRHGR